MSQAAKYKFSNAEDPNDAGALQKALSKMTIGKPQTFGGVLKDASNQNVQYESFNTHTPPDVTANTRVIAVLGLAQERIAPNKDGWFLSDFFAFWRVLNGMTKTQAWYHCLDLDALIQAHTRYLHGNPYKTRKVVLDAEILKKAHNGPYAVQGFEPPNLKNAVTRRITADCKAAEQTGENVLTLLFGHGDQLNRYRAG